MNMIKVIMVMMILSFNLIQIPTVDNQELVKVSLKQFNHHSILLENNNIITKYIEWVKYTNNEHIQTVLLTNYYVNDNTGSGTVTSSGLTIDDFQTNDLGWYVYKEKVVVATATYVCLEATTGACAKYKTLPDGYSIFNLYDEIVIVYEGKEYDGVVLDSMGAGFWKLDDEPYQRIDIFVAQTAKKFGKVVAQIKYYKED